MRRPLHVDGRVTHMDLVPSPSAIISCTHTHFFQSKLLLGTHSSIIVTTTFPANSIPRASCKRGGELPLSQALSRLSETGKTGKPGNQGNLETPETPETGKPGKPGNQGGNQGNPETGKTGKTEKQIWNDRDTLCCSRREAASGKQSGL